jgi:hypothetical protein
MKALTIHQPWAWAIAAGHKRVENRKWSTSHRGELAIHAGSSRKSIESATAFCRDQGIEPPAFDDLPRGAIIAVVDLIDVVDVSTPSLLDRPYDPWAFGPRAWYLDNIRPLTEPVECSGQVGLFGVDDECEARIRQQLSA